jgi:hypothetical protein
MKLIKSILAVLLIEIGFVYAGMTQPATPNFQPGPAVSKFLRALATNDFETIYKMDYETQLQVAQLRRDTPNFLIEKKLQEDFQNQRNAYKGWKPNTDRLFGIPLQVLYFLHLYPEWKVIETRPDPNNTNIFQVYVSFTFNSIERAPFLNPANVYWDIKMNLLKECVFKFNFLNIDSGYYMGAERVGDADVYFTPLPFKIIAARIGPFDGVHIVVMGGTPPLKSKTDIGGVIIEDSAGIVNQGSDSINVHGLYYNNYLKSEINTGANIPGIITVTDNAGHKDIVSFTLPDSKSQRWFVRVPWSENHFYILCSGLLGSEWLQETIYNLLPVPTASQQAELQQIKQMETEAQKNPANTTNLVILGNAYLQMQQTNRAVEMFETALARPEVKIKDAAAVAQYFAQTGNYPKLETTLQKMVSLAPDQPEPLYDLAALQAITGKQTETLQNLKIALNISTQRLAKNPAARDLVKEARSDNRFDRIRSLSEFQKLVPPE